MGRERIVSSGGRRQGRPGRKYPNRSDMRTTQPPKAAPNQTYGEAGSQLASQKQIPLSTSAAPVGSSPAMAAPGPGGGGPPVIPSLSDPTARPNEPITAGLATGPGGGPEMLTNQTDPLLKAAAVLNQMGDTANPLTDTIRKMVNAHLGNKGAA